jgi:putative SOS response-associated peptidase YedK
MRRSGRFCRPGPAAGCPHQSRRPADFDCERTAAHGRPTVRADVHGCLERRFAGRRGRVLVLAGVNYFFLRPKVLIVADHWFYEFHSRVKPQVPYAVFPTDAPCWLIAGLAQRTRLPDGTDHLTVAVITVDPNVVLRSVGHNRSPALLQSGEDVAQWLQGDRNQALALLRPYPDETMGVEAVPMGIKIPGNERVEMPQALAARYGLRG